MLEIPSKYFPEKSLRLSTKNAWAKYVRNRWKANTLGAVQSEWDLTEGEARGVVYAQASQATIDKILDHKDGGFELGLEILCIRLGTTLEEYVARKAEEARREQAEWVARERHLENLSARVSELGRADRKPA